MSAPKNQTVLVVDDESVLRRMIHAALEIKGFHVVAACNGVEALEKLSTQHFDLILTDWNMPGMNGGELISRVQQQYRNQSPPIIVLSCEASPEQSKLERMCIDIWLTKPCRISELQKSVINTINRDNKSCELRRKNNLF